MCIQEKYLSAFFLGLISVGVMAQPDESIKSYANNLEKSVSKFSEKSSNKFEVTSLGFDFEGASNHLALEKNTSKLIKDVTIDLSDRKRGPIEVAVYDQVSSGTVLVMTNEGQGSGALLTEKGHIITNYHVVGDSKYVNVFFKPVGKTSISKTDALKAEVIKVDEYRDLALLKVSVVPPQARAIVLANVDPQVGSDAHAIGHPKGEYWSYTRGYVSGVRPDYQWSADKTVTHQAKVIQTQTPINPGNSGGPLVSDDRKLIGINSFGQPNNPGLNYAVSSEEVQKFLRQDGSRYASKPKSTAVDKKNCGDNPANTGVKKDSDGEYSFIAFDTKCSGKIDMAKITPKNKKKPIRLVLDSNDDEKWDIVIFDDGQDGKWDYSLYDTDYDGKFDVIGYHPDGKIEASKYEKISN